MAYGRRTSKGVKHTILASATLVRPDRTIGDSTELLNYVRETQATRSGASDGERHKSIDFRASINSDLSPGCVREDGVEEDHGVPGAPGLIFVITSRTYFCLHPLSTETSPLLVELHVSQRYLRGGEPLPIEAEVEPFFRGYLGEYPAYTTGGEDRRSLDDASTASQRQRRQYKERRVV